MTDRTQVDTPERRNADCSRVAMRASVSPRDSIDGRDCLVRDANATGCRIVSSHLVDLPDEIWLTFEGVTAPVEGRLIWRDGKQAGVALTWPEAMDATG